MTLSWKNPSTWPPNLPELDCEPDAPELDESVTILLSHCESIQAFHGCRTESSTSYRDQGVVPLAREELDKRAIGLFFSGNFPELSDLDIPKRNEDSCKINQGRIYLAIDDRELLTKSGHYLVYGSEHIIAFAAAISAEGTHDYRKHLKTFGVPTLIEVCIPLDWLSHSELRALCCSLIRARVEGWADDSIDFSITLARSIPPEMIVKITHPNEIFDPLLWQDYKFEI